MRAYYYQRHYRDGRAPGGYDHGPTNRCATLLQALKSAKEFAVQISSCPQDYISIGEGPVRNGYPCGKGRTIATIRPGGAIRWTTD